MVSSRSGSRTSVLPGTASQVLLVALLALAPSTRAVGQVAHLKLIPEEAPAYTYQADMKLSADGVPRVVYGTDFFAAGTTPEQRARDYLAHRGAALQIDESRLRYTTTTETPAGFRVRFVQLVAGVPVFRSDVIVTIAHSGRVAFVVSGFQPGITLRTVASKRSAAEAAGTARDYLGLAAAPRLERVEPMIYVRNGQATRVHRVVLVPFGFSGDWELLVDDASGVVVRAEDRATAHRSPAAKGEAGPAAVGAPAPAPAAAPAGPKAATRPAPAMRSPAPHGAASYRVDASGWVFDPDPLSTSGAAYGGAYADNDDADSPELTAQLREVTLPDVAFDGTTYTLRGPYASITDVEAPLDGVFSQASPQFHYTRADSNFEAVNAYYHLDQSLRYINETLGFSLAPHQTAGPVLFDPHGWEGGDQSSYEPSTATLSFGEGGVDDAEDADVILHELGHGLHDWLTMGGLSQVDGLSEGAGDYWANSYSRSLENWSPGSEERAWVFHWDGHNEFFGGRTTDYDAHYPDGLVDQIHTDGQIWASALMEVWETLGRETTDHLFLEALAMTGATSSQADAAFAFIQADSLVNGGANSEVIVEVFRRRGYLLRANFAASVRAGAAPLSVTFSDASFAAAGIVSWAWDLDGDGTTDSNAQLAEHTYTEPGLYTVTLTVSDGSAQTTREIEHLISVNEGVYLWQGGRGQFDRSGDYLRNHFLIRDIPNAYAHSATMHAPLAGYDAVFLSLGTFSNGATRLDEGMAQALTAYLDQGGRVFLDGAEALGFDQVDNSAFLALFGLSGADDGTNLDAPVQNMQGQAGSLAAGMTFYGSSQVGTTWIDRLTPQAPGIAAFVEDGYGTVAVQHELPNGGKTFVMSYALGWLEDGPSPGSRTDLADAILTFFDVDTHTAVDPPLPPHSFELVSVYPNPVVSQATLQFRLAETARVKAELFNVLGQRMDSASPGRLLGPGIHEWLLDTKALSSGTYLVRLTAGERMVHHPVLVVK